MWVFTETGFVSAVRPNASSTNMRVRARDRQSLESIAYMFTVEIGHSPQRDYPYRVEITGDQFAQWLSQMVQNMEYTNFKSQVYGTRGSKFAHACGSVWATMHEVEDSGARAS